MLHLCEPHTVSIMYFSFPSVFLNNTLRMNKTTLSSQTKTHLASSDTD